MRCLAVLLLAALCHASLIYVIDVGDVITDSTAFEIENGIRDAQLRGADIVLIRLNTPGGVVDATEKIIDHIEHSQVPVVTYVPRGARCYSAGAFILLSGHVAAMANGTATGAATPVAFGPEGISSVEQKVINAFAARMRGIAEERGRNASMAEMFVKEGTSLTASEALNYGVIDAIADSEEDLLSSINSRVVKVGGKDITLKTSNASFHVKKKSISASIAEIIGNPQIAFILFLIGLYGIIFGLSNPGTYVPEVIGAICLIISLYGMGLFDVNIFGIVLIVLGVLLLVAEIFTPGIGALAIGGAICLALGALLLPKPPTPEPSGMFLSYEWWGAFVAIIVAAVATSVAFFLFGLGKAIKARMKRAAIGGDELIGADARAETDIAPEGLVKVRGEIWRARADGEHVRKGEIAKVISREGLLLIVRRK